MKRFETNKEIERCVIDLYKNVCIIVTTGINKINFQLRCGMKNEDLFIPYLFSIVVDELICDLECSSGYASLKSHRLRYETVKGVQNCLIRLLASLDNEG